jgi:hypothetical protein
LNELDCDVCGSGSSTVCCAHGTNGKSGCIDNACCPPNQVTTVGTCCPNGQLADSSGGCGLQCLSFQTPFPDNNGNLLCCDPTDTTVACNGVCCGYGYNYCDVSGACALGNGIH